MRSWSSGQHAQPLRGCSAADVTPASVFHSLAMQTTRLLELSVLCMVATAPCRIAEALSCNSAVSCGLQAADDSTRLQELQESVMSLTKQVQQLLPLQPRCSTLEVERDTAQHKLDRLQVRLCPDGMSIWALVNVACTVLHTHAWDRQHTSSVTCW